jgi:nicotinamidase-related amidase
MIMPAKTWMRKYVLVDIDTQKHFFNDAGVVCVRNHRRVLANILRVIKWARLRNVRAVSTVQIFPDRFPRCSRRIPEMDGRSKINYTFRKRFTSFDAEDRTDLMPRILDYYDQVIFEKRCFDPFEEPRADRMLSELDAQEFVLVGALTEGAVRATALGLLSRRKNVTVVVDATGSYNRRAGPITLRLLLERGAKLTDARTFLASCCS